MTFDNLLPRLYGIGRQYDENTDQSSYWIWEIDWTNGHLTPILPLKFSLISGQWITIPGTGRIYWLGKKNDLYYCDTAHPSCTKIGELPDKCSLCIIDGQLHALLETENENYESFLSLAAVDPVTANLTPVADFGSIHQALGIPAGSVSMYPSSEYLYNPATQSLIASFLETKTYYDQIIRLDIPNQRIIPGEIINKKHTVVSLFSMGHHTCATIYPLTYYDFAETIELRPIDTTTVALKESIGKITLGYRELCLEDPFFFYEPATSKGYGIFWKNFTYDNAYQFIGSYDFHTKQFFKFAILPDDIDLWLLISVY